jgi:hypothetical protein
MVTLASNGIIGGAIDLRKRYKTAAAYGKGDRNWTGKNCWDS